MFPEDQQNKGYASTYFKECRRLQEMLVHPLPAVGKFVLYTNAMAREPYPELVRMHSSLLQQQLQAGKKVGSLSATSGRQLGASNRRGTKSASICGSHTVK